MKTIWHNSEDIRFDIYLSGLHESALVDEIIMYDPDNVVWGFDDNSALLAGIITPEIIDDIAYEFAPELEQEWRENEADSIHDWLKEN